MAPLRSFDILAPYKLAYYYYYYYVSQSFNETFKIEPTEMIITNSRYMKVTKPETGSAHL